MTTFVSGLATSTQKLCEFRVEEQAWGVSGTGNGTSSRQAFTRRRGLVWGYIPGLVLLLSMVFTIARWPRDPLVA